MALAMSSLTLFLLSLFLFLHFPSPAFSHTPLPEHHFEQLCNLTRDSDFCMKLQKGDISSIKKVDDNSETVRIFNEVREIAEKAKEQISKDVNCTNVKMELKDALRTCLTSYTEAFASLSSCTTQTPRSMDDAFRVAEKSIWPCREAVKHLPEQDLPIAFLKAANHLVHHFIVYGTLRTSYVMHPTSKLTENW